MLGPYADRHCGGFVFWRIQPQPCLEVRQHFFERVRRRGDQDCRRVESLAGIAVGAWLAQDSADDLPNPGEGPIRGSSGATSDQGDGSVARLTYDTPSPALDGYESLSFQQDHGPVRGARRHGVAGRELIHCRDAVTRSQFSVLDRLTELRRDAFVRAEGFRLWCDRAWT